MVLEGLLEEADHGLAMCLTVVCVRVPPERHGLRSEWYEPGQLFLDGEDVVDASSAARFGRGRSEIDG